MLERGQTGVEYLLLAGAVLVFVAAVLVVVETQVFVPSKAAGGRGSQSAWQSIEGAGNFSSTNFVYGCGTVSVPGSYRLVADLSPSASCIVVAASNVVFDCDSHLINFSGGAPNQYGVVVQGSNVTLKNCVVAFFARGVSLQGANNSLQSVSACNSSDYDFWVGASQLSASGLSCGLNKCFQDGGAWGVCVPNVAGASNCSSSC